MKLTRDAHCFGREGPGQVTPMGSQVDFSNPPSMFEGGGFGNRVEVRKGEVVLDRGRSRALQLLMAQYGPCIKA